MATTMGDFTLQEATFYSALLGWEFQATSLVWREIEVMNIGLNRTYTGQYLTKMRSNMVGESQRPIFQVPEIVAYEAKVSAYEAPVYVSDTSVANVQFSPMVASMVARSIGMELGRRADRVVIAGINAQYDRDHTIDLPAGSYYDVQTITSVVALLGNLSARGRIIHLIDHIQYANLTLDDRFSRWNFNEARPLTQDVGEPYLNNRLEYAGQVFLKLPQDIALPKASADRVRMFTFTRDSLKGIFGVIDPYGLFGVKQEHQLHRGGWDFNSRLRLGMVVEQKNGIVAIEAPAGEKPRA